MDKQKPIKLEYNEGCMSWGTYINDVPLSDYSLEDLKSLAKELIDSIGDGQNNYYIFQQFFDSFILYFKSFVKSLLWKKVYMKI